MAQIRKIIFHFGAARASVLTALLILLATGCSYISLPSIPWSKAAEPNPTAEALHQEGMTFLANKKYVLAIERFQRIRAEFPFSPQLITAEVKLGEAYYLNKQYPEAISAFKEFQTMHPNNENIPFVVYHLGLAHFDQFTHVDRDQKTTGIAKDYFESVVKNYATSPYSQPAGEKLAKCLGYLAEHEYNVGNFYMKEKNYPAARDRWEEILRRYPGTPLAPRSLYGIAESYRSQKNAVKAALAYEALIQHYPETQLAKDARLQLAQLEKEKEKQDPLALLLMRDHRPSYMPSPNSGGAGVQTAEAPKRDLKDVQLIAKKEVVYEEPGSEKGIFRRVVDTLNPFSSSSSSEENAGSTNGGKKPDPQKESSGFLASLWPFGKGSSDGKRNAAGPRDPELVSKVDESLKEKGIDPGKQNSPLTPPAGDLSAIVPVANTPPPDTAALLSRIDETLNKDGKSVAALPPAPEPDPAFSKAAAAQKTARPEPARPAMPGDLLTSIDQNLRSKGIDVSKSQLPALPSSPTASKAETQPVKSTVELNPKLPVEKGPFFLERGEVRVQDLGKAEEEKQKAETQKIAEPIQELPRSVVSGPAPHAKHEPPELKPVDKKRSSEPEDEESKGVLDQLREQAETIGNILNPFKW
ncbi:MAG: outer membrane protein assembly factor BamD [Deltaproteobacteria bacterium]|nr:outer membrane protein assembly factor BamD [Deltaproteobacteria bacterium]